jgi:hypothetical protein
MRGENEKLYFLQNNKKSQQGLFKNDKLDIYPAPYFVLVLGLAKIA